MAFSLVLASNSPRRKELLRLTGWGYDIKPADVDERVQPGETPQAYVRRLAEWKARKVGKQSPRQIVLAADTTVADRKTILGKPASVAEATAMLVALRGKTHQVYTAISVFDVRRGKLVSELCCTQVPMRSYSPQEMLDYINSGDPLDKAGAYAIQHAGFHPVENFRGCFASVMGLPLCHLARAAAQVGLAAPADVPAACQAHLGYTCPIWQDVAAGKNAG